MQQIDGDSHAVFFDLGGVWWVAYSRTSARVLHLVAGGMAVAAMCTTAVRPAVLVRELVAVVAALVAAAAVGATLWQKRPMACYGSEALALALYPSLALAVALYVRDGAFPRTNTAPKRKGGSSSSPTNVRSLGAAALFPWLLSLVGLEAAGLGSAYLPAMICACNGAGLLLAHRMMPPAPSAHAMGATIAQLLGALLPLAHLSELCAWLLEVLLPITGRTGVVIPSDVVIGVAVSVIAALGGSPLTAVLHTSRPTIRRLCTLLLLLSAASFYAAVQRAPIFHAAAPKRLLVQHVAREVNGQPYDTGIWMSGFDAAGLRELRETPRRKLGVPAVHMRDQRECDLDLPSTGCYLSLPYFFPLSGAVGTPDGVSAVYATEMTRSSGARATTRGAAAGPVEPPPIAFAERLRLERFVTTNSSNTSQLVSRLSLRVSGPSHMALVLPEGRLAAWSLTPTAPPPRRSPFDPEERVVFAFVTNGGEDGRGEPKKARVWDLWLE